MKAVGGFLTLIKGSTVEKLHDREGQVRLINASEPPSKALTAYIKRNGSNLPLIAYQTTYFAEPEAIYARQVEARHEGLPFWMSRRLHPKDGV